MNADIVDINPVPSNSLDEELGVPEPEFSDGEEESEESEESEEYEEEGPKDE
jgi:hypothetical protein